ncbi:nitroreductase [Sphingomonas sp. PL-96]|uniref:nitroreductase family protein n=1 Tax=Sphingomonas sp. PL-96 TaxID=2887201 RepID=UPI001E5DF036|nr:nitroreductase [Sphingomonas sp. PL-96]MCC2977472.1 nitroreductase [Sphingomonas sp. PL-96]
MTFNDRTTPLSLLATRRSGKPREMVAPGPDDAQIDAMLALAARTPDHGKLAPWRFVVVPQGRRAAFNGMLVDAYRAEKPDAARLELEAMATFGAPAPALVVVLSAPRSESHIPLWEQQMSVGAATMNLLHAAHAMGFVASWITGWPSMSPTVRDAFGADPERVVGFVFIGTPGKPLEERPRPDLSAVVTRWQG